MSQYKIISTWHQEIAETCQDCGRAIKNIVLLENTVTREHTKVGLTCFGKLMNLNEKFDKVVQNEIKKYYKIVEKVESLKNYKTDYNNLIKSMLEEFQIKIMSDKDIKDFVTVRYIGTLNDLIKKTESLNNFSKTGKIQLENITDLKKQYKIVSDEYML